MNNVCYSFMVSALAGLSTLFGSALIFFNLKNTYKVILRSLSFASGVMLCICIIDLIPSSFKGFNALYKVFPSLLFVLIFIVIGIIISSFIDILLPDDNYNISNKHLYRAGFISMIAIVFHNIPEGILTFMLSTHDLKLGISMAFAIALHNIPEGISISVPIYYSTNSKSKAFIYTFISGISELFGAVLTYLFLSAYINDFLMSSLLAGIAGLMIYIPIYELMPISLSYNRRKESIVFLILGVLFMFINHFVFN